VIERRGEGGVINWRHQLGLMRPTIEGEEVKLDQARPPKSSQWPLILSREPIHSSSTPLSSFHIFLLKKEIFFTVKLVKPISFCYYPNSNLQFYIVVLLELSCGLKGLQGSLRGSCRSILSTVKLMSSITVINPLTTEETSISKLQ
jgi:hypothetical protein